MSERQWTRKHEWRTVRPESGNVRWTAYHDDLNIGTVMPDTVSPRRGGFDWSGNCSSWWSFKRPMPSSGWEQEAWRAAKAVEDCYDAGCEATGPRPTIVAEIIKDTQERLANWPYGANRQNNLS